VLSIADAFDCMTSVRSYRPARPVSDAVEELVRCRGKQFDPELVDLFVAAVGRDGWQPAPVEEVPADVKTPRYDHDDPTRPPEVERSPEARS
jgi:HD-GYP domain-containing protein (c-di-GMP phosphodiesterase class II)